MSNNVLYKDQGKDVIDISVSFLGLHQTLGGGYFRRLHLTIIKKTLFSDITTIRKAEMSNLHFLPKINLKKYIKHIFTPPSILSVQMLGKQTLDTQKKGDQK
jgi:hypothetical protein